MSSAGGNDAPSIGAFPGLSCCTRGKAKALHAVRHKKEGKGLQIASNCCLAGLLSYELITVCVLFVNFTTVSWLATVADHLPDGTPRNYEGIARRPVLGSRFGENCAVICVVNHVRCKHTWI